MAALEDRGSGLPTLYFLDNWEPAALAHARRRATTVLIPDVEHEDWRQHARYLLVRGSRLTAHDIDAIPHLRAIAKPGAGTDKIDPSACAARDIQILNTPGVNARSVAELVLGLTMSVARDIAAIQVKQQAMGERVAKSSCSGEVLHGRTLGVIGMGHIGHSVAKIFQGAFESPIVAYDPYLPLDAWPDLKVVRADTVESLLRQSDIVTIHVPLLESTRNLLNYESMKQMKPNSILINAARGGIVNEADLERALREGLIYGAGLDCHECEPPTKDQYSSLWTQRVVSTPHIGAATAQARLGSQLAAVDSILRFATSNT